MLFFSVFWTQMEKSIAEKTSTQQTQEDMQPWDPKPQQLPQNTTTSRQLVAPPNLPSIPSTNSLV
jgi:hypothetical protein